METIKRTTIIFLDLFSCIGCDQVTKNVAKQNLTGIEPIRVFNDTFRLQYAENPSAFLSFGENIPDNLRYLIFILITGAFLIGLLIYLIKSEKINRPNTIGLSLILGGGFGNLIDRIFNEGRIVDFLNLGIGSIRTGIFNVADIAITFGVAWLLYFSTTKRNHKEKSI